MSRLPPRLARPLTVLAIALSPAVHAETPACWAQALAHLRAAPDGFAIYRQAADPDVFKAWVRCDDAQFDLSTAVHETTHVVTSETDAFPLVGGGAVPLPHEVSAFYQPRRIAGRFPADDFTTIYLHLGKASSATDLLFLLDELDAYTHDLATAVALKDLAAPDVAIDHRDGLAALMAFVSIYAEVARESEPATWEGLRRPRVARTIGVLWGQAERVMASSCDIPNFGDADIGYLRRVCAPEAQAAIGAVIGRAPICPRACLAPRRDGPGFDGPRLDKPGLDSTPTASISERRAPPPTHRQARTLPDWLSAVIRTVSPGKDDAYKDDAHKDDAQDR